MTKTLPVKWFNDAKGYGFLDDAGVSVFVHYSVILGDGFKTLYPGQFVDAVIVDGGKGLQATSVYKRLDLPPSAEHTIEDDT